MRSQSLIWKKGDTKYRQTILQSCYLFQMQFFLHTDVEEHNFLPFECYQGNAAPQSLAVYCDASKVF